MVGRRGKRGAPAANPTPATRSSRNPPTSSQPSSRARGRGRGRGRWANHWANRLLPGRAAPADDQGEPPRRSHILKFKVPSLRKLGLGTSSTSSAPDQADAPTAASTQHPETPRGRRSKRAMAVPESSRTTRQSARLKPSGEMTTTEEATPSKAVDDAAGVVDGDADAGADADADATELEEESPSSSSPEQQQPEDVKYAPRLRLRLSPQKTPTQKSLSTTDQVTDPDQPQISTEAPAMPDDASQQLPQQVSQKTKGEHQSPVLPAPETASFSPRLSRKRKSSELKDEFESAEMPYPSTTATKKLKLEDPSELSAHTLQQNGNNSTGPPQESSSSPPDNGTLPEAPSVDPVASIEGPVPSGRGRGRGRGRARGRGSRGGAGGRGGALGLTRGAGVRGRGGRGRGRGRGSAAAAIRRGGKRIEDEIWDSESRRRTPSPVPATQPLKDRAEELAALFKKVGQAQQLALSVLAERSMQTIARDKNAHLDCPEYDQVMRDLADKQRRALTSYRNQYDLKVDSAEKVYQGNLFIIEQRTKAQIKNIKEEMFLAARGKYIELVAGRRAQEDDEHTETDGSDGESDEPRYLFRIGKAGLREVERGFIAEAVRAPDGAAAYERGEQEWEDFIMKVRLGEDLNPQMQALDSSIEASSDYINRTVESLLEAARTVAEESEGLRSYDGAADVSKALSVLADTALSDPRPAHYPQMRPEQQHMAGHHVLLPQGHQGVNAAVAPPPPPGMAHGPTDPRSFILPRPTPTQQPRRLLPARSPLGMGLPDPFAMTGPPQLPPPMGSNFQRLPLPSWSHGVPQGGTQQPGPGHGPGSTGSHGGPVPPHGGPPSLYYPGPQQPRRY